jgi:hypothetical protein
MTVVRRRGRAREIGAPLILVFKSGSGMQQPPADGTDEAPPGAEAPKREVRDVAALLQQIKEHQEAYEILYSRNVLLHNELTEAKQTIALCILNTTRLI